MKNWIYILLVLSAICAVITIFFMVSISVNGIAGHRLFFAVVPAFFSGIFCAVPVTLVLCKSKN